MERKITKEIFIAALPKYVFNTLITPSMIKQWWYVSSAIVIPEINGIYALTWGEDIDHAEFTTVSRITEFEFSKRLVMVNEIYYSPNGSLPFDAQLEASFSLVEQEGGTLLTLLQEGIPEDNTADEFYQGALVGWENTLKSLKNVAEDEAASMDHMESLQ